MLAQQRNVGVVSNTDDSIAEMRVAYGGSGTLSQLQKPRWGTEIWDIIFPF
jgi:flagellar L-ring protein precursor FlgH